MNRVQEALRAHSTAIVAMPGGMVFRIRRVRGSDLAMVGHAELVGSADARAALEELQRELGDRDDSVEAQRRRLSAAIEYIAKDPHRVQAYYRRLDAYFCAGVSHLGALAAGDERLGEIPDEGIDWLGEVAFVPEEAEADHEEVNGARAPRVWCGQVPDEIRRGIALAVIGLGGVTDQVKPFRPTARAAADDPPDR